MKPIISILLVFFLHAGTGRSVYNFKLKNLEHRTVSYNELKGEQLTVIDFWATWCKPCIKSIPKLVEMQKELKSQGVQFIAVSVDGPRNLNKVKPFARSLGIDYPVLLDTDNDVMSRLGIRAVPTLLVVNSDDEIVLFHEGYSPGEEQLIRHEILNHLNR